jgi:hypothetical protein
MKSLRLSLIGLTFLVSVVMARGDDWPKLRLRGGEVYYADAELRAAFAKEHPAALPESKRKLQAVTAASFDWSAHVSRTFNYTQAKNPQCWAFAAVTAFEWNWAIRNGGTVPILAVQPIIDRSQKEGGAPTRVALEVLLEQGTCPLTAYPYTGKAEKVRTNVKLAYRAIAWGDVTTERGVPETMRIKQALLDHGPVVAGVYVTPLFDGYKGGIFKEHFKVPEDGKQVTHSVVIIGWDDRKGKGCWKVQNSWGPKWGDGGNMWIEYGCNNIGLDAQWVRAQSDQYRLPETAHKLIPGDIVPFHQWTNARTVTAPPAPEIPTITPAEALKKPGERVVVNLTVKGCGIVNPLGHVELYSESLPTDEGCLTLRLLKSDLDRFPAKEPQALLKLYRGKQLRVRGSVQPVALRTGTRLVIEVVDPGQIEEIK